MKWVVARRIRAGYARLNRRDLAPVLARFAPDARFRFGGDHPLAADLRGRDAIGAWFERAFALLPDLRFEVEDVIVTGVPWRMRIVTRYTARVTQGVAYTGVQFAAMRWATVTEDLLYPDTQAVAAALRGAEAAVA